jgi:hypothetical protein
MMYFVKIDQLRYPDMTTALQHAIILMLIGIPSSLKQLLFLCSKGNFLQRTGVIMCLPSQLCQISIDTDQVSGKLKHDISSIYSTQFTQIRPSDSSYGVGSHITGSKHYHKVLMTLDVSQFSYIWQNAI